MARGIQVGQFRGNFGLAALEKWASLLTDERDRKGWPRFFPAGRDLLAALLAVYVQIELRGRGLTAAAPKGGGRALSLVGPRLAQPGARRAAQLRASPASVARADRRPRGAARPPGRTGARPRCRADGGGTPPAAVHR